MEYKQAFTKEQKQRINKLIDDMTLFDDSLMSHVFDENIKATELMLRIILQEEIKVISVDGQDEFKNPIVGGRNITLDVHAIDSQAREIDIEVQGNTKGTAVERARFHSSMLDARMLKANQDFNELKDSYVIFICKNDKFKHGKPLYYIERFVSETNEPVDDGSHIIYVNGSYEGSDDLAKLMEDFHQKNTDEMHFEELANGVRHFKDKEGGCDNMSDSVEAFAKDYAEEQVKKYEVTTKLDIARNLIKDLGLSIDQALELVKINNDQRDFFISELNK